MSTYKWTYDTSVFTAAGPITEASIKLVPKPGFDMSILVSPISVEIVDSNGCKSSKQCYYTPNGMECDDYLYCPNVRNLKVVNTDTYCPAIKNLVVKNI